MTTAGGGVARCTGAGWLTSCVESPGSSGHLLSPTGRYTSARGQEEETVTLIVKLLLTFKDHICVIILRINEGLLNLIIIQLDELWACFDLSTQSHSEYSFYVVGH